MTTNNQCNHALEIAKNFYYEFKAAKSTAETEEEPAVFWDDLTAAEKHGWLSVAEQAIPIIATHALGDVKDYLGIKASGASSWWKKALYWAGVGIVGAVLGGWGMSLSGCGHSVDVTPGRTEVCKDGSCLVIEQGHISYSQAQPQTEVAPVVQVIPSKK